MKILKIKFENIHSLKGVHEVDFAQGPLAEAGLFAITGPTGSGKSTLLDVITLALFNRIARVDKAVSNTILEDDGGIMTRNMKHCYAEVEYRVNGKDYRSHWSIERNRNNNLNQRKQELVEMATGTILESTTKTPDKNAEIIGLSYDQFIKAMVLSQGEFSKLLQAPRNERNKLLEDITGARSYREIGKAVFQKYRNVQKDIELKKANLEGIELLSKETIAEKKGELEDLIRTKPEVEKKYQSASDKVKTRKELQLKEKEWKDLESKKVELKKNLEQFLLYKKELEVHDQLSKYSSNLREYDVTEKELENLQNQENQLRLSKAETQKQQENLLKNISVLVKGEVDIKTATAKLEDFRNKIVELQAEEKKKFSEAKLFQDQLNSNVTKIQKLDYDLPQAEKPEKFQLELESFERNLKETIEDSGIRSMEELNATLNRQRQMYEKSANLITKKEQAVSLQLNLENQRSKFKTTEVSVDQDLLKTKTLKQEIEFLAKEVKEMEKTLEHQRKHQSLEQYREQLQEDLPCPLCGSLNHPYASEEPYFDIKEELLQERKTSLQTKSELVAALSEKNKLQRKSMAELEADIKKIIEEQAKIENNYNALAKELNWNPNETLEIYKGKRIQLVDTIGKAEKLTKAFEANTILEDAIQSFKYWKNASTTYLYTRKERSALYEGHDVNKESNNLSSKITHTIANISSLETQLIQNRKKMGIVSSERDKKEKDLEKILLKENLEKLSDLRKGIMPEERAGKIRKRDTELSEQKTRISEKGTSLEKTLIELKEKDDSETSLDKLLVLLDESKKQNDDLLLNIGKISESLEKDRKDRERQLKVLDEIALMSKDLSLWKTMNNLIGDANGNRFSNFVQDLTLEQLIGFANKRLAEFSDRYLLDIPTAEESENLKVFDKYMGNARRSVVTLSGGETFLVSLAMAFALSDIAARNVKIESLFIDEGFGTLDPETLDQAITILEKMQNEGDKSVGVISHVSALKERITTQIKLDKGSLGYSTLEVIQ